MTAGQVGKTEPLHVLLIEDSPDDALMIEHLVELSGLDVCLDRVEDGETAIAYLTAGGESGAATGVQFILLDLSLPRLNGIEVLRRIKANPLFEDIPVIILSGTDDEEAIRDGQDLRAHTHIVKPMSLKEFVWIVTSVQHYWPRIQRLRALSAM